MSLANQPGRGAQEQMARILLMLILYAYVFFNNTERRSRRVGSHAAAAGEDG